LKDEGVIITKKRMLLADGSELYSAKFSVGSQKVVIERSGNELCLEELAISALMCIIVYEGYKAKITCNGRTKTFNFKLSLFLIVNSILHHERRTNRNTSRTTH
jgi:hypothetical protein